MAYKNNIPQATDEIKVSSGDIRENFSQIGTVFAINHEAFNTDNAGKHKFLQMPEQVAPPTTLADEGALFTAQGTYSGVTELMYRRESNGSTVQITQGLANTTAILPGFAYIGNSLVKWGITSLANAAAGTYTVTFPVAAGIPVFATIPFIIIEDTNSGDTGNLRKWTGVATPLSFDIVKVLTAGNVFVRFLAIGT